MRPAGKDHGDQSRVVTPAEAIAAGATYIVVGRPITAAANPGDEARAILEQMSLCGQRVIEIAVIPTRAMRSERSGGTCCRPR